MKIIERSRSTQVLTRTTCVQVLGGALLGGGIFLKVASDQTASVVDQIKSNIPDLANGAQIDDAAATASPLMSDDDINDLLNGIIIAFIVLGAFLFLLGMSGCCGACCAIKTMLIIVSVVGCVCACVRGRVRVRVCFCVHPRHCY